MITHTTYLVCRRGRALLPFETREAAEQWISEQERPEAYTVTAWTRRYES